MYTAKTVTGETESFESMQDAKRFAISRGDGGVLTDNETGVIYRVKRQRGVGLCDFFDLKIIK